MRAITVSGYGRPTDVLKLEDVAEPTIGEDEVLVGIQAASLNPADWHLIRGVPYLARLQVGLRRPGFVVPGSDLAGVVEAVGAAVTTLQVGDEVYGTTFMAGFGAFAEKAAVPAPLLARRPQDASFEDAAAVPLAASTALQALRNHGNVRNGDRVMIIGASGGVGTFAVQLAKHLGATVTAVCSTANAQLVTDLGADAVVDYTTTDPISIDARYDLVLQLAGTHPSGRLRHLLTPTGTLVQISGDSPNRWVGPLRRILAGQLRSKFAARTITSFTVKPARDDLELLAKLIDDGTITASIHSVHSLDRVPEALEQLETGHSRGKAIITID